MASSRHILVVGGNSFIGEAVSNYLTTEGCCVLHTSRRGSQGKISLDLANIPSNWQPPSNIDAALLAAGVTSTEECRRNYEECRRINVTGTFELSRRLILAGIRVVFISTNHVFAGDSPFPLFHSPRCPKTAYGRLKAETEQLLLTLGDGVTVVRLTKVLTGNLPVIQRWRVALNSGSRIYPLSDLKLSPISVTDATEVLAAALTESLGPILHVSAKNDISYAQLAMWLAEAWQADKNLVIPSYAHDLAVPLEHLPKYTTLGTEQLPSKLGFVPPSPWNACRECL